ncbi:hypothetical protein D3C80_2160260 [compost metagenome]
MLVPVCNIKKQLFGSAVTLAFNQQAGQFEFGGDIVGIKGNRSPQSGHLPAPAEGLADAWQDADIPAVQNIQDQ